MENRSHIYEMTLSEPWFGLVAARIKDIELRVMDEKRSQINIGDTIAFRSKSDQVNMIIYRKVIDLMIFWDFRSALEQLGLHRTLPGRAKNLDDGLNIYHSIDKYQEKAQKYGVIAFILK